MEEDKILTAKSFNLKHRTGEIDWDAQADGEYLEWNEMHATVSAWKEDTVLDDDANLSEVSFDKF